MSDLLQVLYTYVLDHLYIDDPEYEQNRLCAQRRLDRLLQTLTPEQRRLLTEYQDMSLLADTAGLEAVFRSALETGLRLGTLHHA